MLLYSLLILRRIDFGAVYSIALPMNLLFSFSLRQKFCRNINYYLVCISDDMVLVRSSKLLTNEDLLECGSPDSYQ